MNILRPSAVAMLVSAALSGTAAHASGLHNHATTLSNFNHASTTSLKSGAVLLAAREKAKAERATQSGMQSHFDAKMGKATFLWAPKGQSVPDMHLIAPENKNAYAASYYLNSLTGFTTEENALNRVDLAYIHDNKRGGPIVAKYRQELNGVSIFNKEYNIAIDREHNLVAGSGYLGNKVTPAQMMELFGSFDTPENAIARAVKDLSGGKTEVSLEMAGKNQDYLMFDATTLKGMEVIGQPRAKRVFYENNGELIAAHYVEITLSHFESLSSEDYSYVIGNRGKILFRKNLTSHASSDDHGYTYRVWADEDGFPYQGPHGKVLPQAQPGNDPSDYVDQPLITIDHFDKISTDDPWLPEGAMYTSGNNVFAFADVFAPDGFNDGDIVVSTTSDKTFDYPHDNTKRDNSFVNRQSAVVNMFVVNNFLHDWWYDHGFDEASGNAQLDNYGRGGVEGDPLRAEAQDFESLNNATMATPADGASPRMQQYLWTSKDAVNGVDQGVNIISHPGSLGTMQSTRLSSFGPQQYDAITANLRRLQDGNDTDSGSKTDGCEAAINPHALDGKIAIIDRGSCNFTLKVLNAQNAGAIGAIIVNNVDDGSPAPMGGSDPAVTIPNVGLNFEEGAALYERIDAGTNVTAEIFSNFELKDSSFDNGIIAHEWGHYIQHRLVGNASGLNNHQGGSMGEGWSDFHSMMFNIKADDVNIEGNSEWQHPYATGTYVEEFYTGVRRVPYTPNMDINPLTFKHIVAGAEVPGVAATRAGSPHDAGEIWGTVLWDVYVRLLNMYDFDTAESRMADYLVASYKMTPVSPTYTEARDALLSVMLAGSADDYNAALEAFARRGMGFGAISPDRDSEDNAGLVESYSTELASFTAGSFNMSQDPAVGVCTNDDILDAGETASVSFTVTNNGSETLSGVTAQVQVLSEHDVTLENDGLVTFDDIGLFSSADSGPVSLTLNSAGTGDTLMLGVTFPEQAEGDDIVEATDLALGASVNFDFAKLPLVGNSAMDNMETLASIENFKENVMDGGADAVGTSSLHTEFTAFMQSLNPSVDLGNQMMYLVNNGFQSDVAIETTEMEVAYGQDFSISFWHFYWLEENWDGAVLEISVNGSNWMDVTAAEGTFSTGYSTTALNANPTQAIQDRPAWTGINGDLATFAGNEETVSFGTELNGQLVKFRFRLSSDLNTADFGWFIDNVRVTNITTGPYDDTTGPFYEVVAGDAVACD